MGGTQLRGVSFRTVLQVLPVTDDAVFQESKFVCCPDLCNSQRFALAFGAGQYLVGTAKIVGPNIKFQ